MILVSPKLSAEKKTFGSRSRKKSLLTGVQALAEHCPRMQRLVLHGCSKLSGSAIEGGGGGGGGAHDDH